VPRQREIRSDDSMSKLWKDFWTTYRYDGTLSEERLFEQVGRTVNGKPIAPEAFALTGQQASDLLELGPDDVLFEYCCGNGLVTFELAQSVREVVAVDFTEHLIAGATQFRQRKNIRYVVGDALEPLEQWLNGARPNKFLMAAALQHFEPAGLDRILANICKVAAPGTFRFLLTSIPNDARKWTFYDTPQRKERYLANVAAGSVTNDGLGRWWTGDEISAIAVRHGLAVEIIEEPAALGSYRMSALLT
jgi:SAM-dependent methyltransferase